jgi:microsomal dipeptidase-like Zn-dependent dipeptidase
LKKLVFTAITVAVLVAIAVELVFPQVIESRYNKVLRRPPYSASAAALSLHHTLTVVDLHADSLLWGRNLLRRSSRGHVDVPRLLTGNVAVQTFTVVTKIPKGLNLNHNGADSDGLTALAISEGWPPATWHSLKERALYQASRLRRMADDSHGKLVLIATSVDLNSYLEKRKQGSDAAAGLLGLEGTHALEGRLENVDELFRAGFRVIGLSHFFDNEFAGSSTGVRQGGLTPKGRELVRLLESRHMLIDLAHSSGATINEMTAMATRPVIVSHTGVRGTCNNARNLTDKQIREVAQTGGVIGIGYWSTAVCGTDAGDIAKAIRYAASVGGVDHVALGSDFDGSTIMPFDTTGLVQITDALFKEGFSEEEIRLITGENALRVLRQTLP